MYSQSISLFRRLNRWYSAKSNRRETALQASFAMNLCAVVFAANGYKRYALNKNNEDNKKQADIDNETLHPEGYVIGGQVHRDLLRAKNKQ